MLSSLMMTGVCVAACKRSMPFRRQRIAFLTIFFLVFMGLATAFGGLMGHGFLHKTGMAGKLPGWIFGVISLAFYERGVIYRLEGLVPQKQLSRLLAINLAGVTAFVLMIFYFRHFMVSQYHAMYSLLLLIGTMELYIYRKTRYPGSPYVFYAILMAALAGVVHLSGLGLGVWCQANDISHIPMAACIWLLYLAMEKGGFESASTAGTF